MNLTLPEDVKTALRRRERVADSADLTFRACPVCASMTWLSTCHDGTGQVTATIDDFPCAQCDLMRARHGELFEYLLYIIRGQQMLRRMSEGS